MEKKRETDAKSRDKIRRENPDAMKQAQNDRQKTARQKKDP